MITADEIRSRLPVDKSRLDDELEMHSQVAEQVSRTVAALERDVAFAKDELKRYEAGLFIDFKNEKDSKQTKDEVEARVIRDRVRGGLFKNLVTFEEQLATWKGLQSAWRDKGFSMRTLADLHSSSYFDSASALNQRRERNEERGNYRDSLSRHREQQATASEGERPRRRMTE